jgi:hypothetical protein
MTKFSFNNSYQNITYFFIFLIIIFSSLGRLNHNDFNYYAVAATHGKLYVDINSPYFPLSYFINKFLFYISPGNYEYLVMRLASILFYIFSILALQSLLKNNEQRLVFTFLSIFYASVISFEIGSNTSAFFFFIISYIFYFEKKNNEINFFLGSLFLGLSISVRVTYLVMSLPFLILLIKKNNFKSLIFYSFLGGFVGLSPVLFYLLFDLNTFLFWTVKYHNIHTEAYRFFSIKNYLIDMLMHFKKHYYPIVILFFIYFFNLLISKSNTDKTKELLILFFLFVAGCLTLVVHKQYFEPFIIVLIYFSLKTINFNKNKIIFYVILIFGFFHYLLDNRLNDFKKLNLDHNYFYVQDVRFFFKNNFLGKNCSIKTRTAATIFIPESFIQHKHNLHGIWFERLRPHSNKIERYNKYFDNTLLTFDYDNSEFNSILVGYYINHSFDNQLVKYAKNKKWEKYSYRGLDFYIDKNCK